MRASRSLPVVLTIAGSDSGGGAGIQADLKTFFALGTHGLTVVTAVTAQNPVEVSATEPCKPGLIRAQLEAIVPFEPRAAKTGMLLTRQAVTLVAEFFRRQKIPLVVDPVMMATSGATLLRRKAWEAMKRDLLPLATLVTPNTAEAEALTGIPIHEPEDLRRAARAIHQQFGCAALLKGGHLETGRCAIDLFYDGKEELLIEAVRKRRIATHGTGCTYSAAIAAFLARGRPLVQAVCLAKGVVTQAIYGTAQAGPFSVLNHR